MVRRQPAMTWCSKGVGARVRCGTPSGGLQRGQRLVGVCLVQLLLPLPCRGCPYGHVSV